MAGLETVEELRDELRLTVDYLPKNRLREALITLENMLEFNNGTIAAIDDVMNNRNLLGPYYTPEEMLKAVLDGDDDEDDEKI